ncbi:Cyclomaltodextrinase [Clostridium sp. N3C]|uniref:alpha-amylase family glycosyl hydrolase n=1 Tax=Clostridium sp. N3C TaxID=1776758 RepID=UPI00092E127C|nr:alpha-amylase family glycosyl hydrolase [Clostridium sp. N3C]SCN23408.1 Cyclomaltodextrinase [Clostridium sp. N3C]
MALDTSKKLRNAVIYSVYVRNYGKNGKFIDIEEDLQRIKDLGTDIVWFMPIHPIGEVNRKGILGSPYAIKDYRAINPEYGTLEDFKRLVDKIHQLGMKVMIDVVYNHTSPDSWLVGNHPEYFYIKPDGKRGNKVGDWSDIVDLDYNNKDLWTYQIDTLKYWAEIGVDGFRCDVAPLVPIEFWMKAREEVKKVKPEVIWLAESVEHSFISYLRKEGFVAHSDCEVYNAFDICYDYDVHNYFKGYLEGKNTLKEYIDRVAMQEVIYPDNYVKLRFLENHDQPRAKHLIPDNEKLNIWTAYMFFQKGAALIFNGQEAKDDKIPNLFNDDKVNWAGMEEDFVSMIKKLAALKKEPIMAEGNYSIGVVDNKDVIVITYEKGHEKLIGIFNVNLEDGTIKLPVEDGEYENLVNGKKINIREGEIELPYVPVIIRA